MRISPTSVDTLIIYVADNICLESVKMVRNVYETLKQKCDFIIELTPSYTSVLVRYNLLDMDFEEAKEMILKTLENSKSSQKETSLNLVEIPVFYDVKVGLDLEEVASLHGLSIQEVIDIHSQKEYLVYAIGFLPGFAYMGEVDEKIATPRVANPRANIPKGSVGIADSQAAIYPQKSPGGWRILGRTPLNMFDLDYDGYSFLKVGDRVRYKPINEEEFLSQGGEL